MNTHAATWALLTGGWIVLAHASDRLAPGPWWHAALLAGWLVALPVAGRCARRAWLVPACALVAAAALAWAVDGALWWALWPALAAWAVLIALVAPPAGEGRAALSAAALGAFAAWGVLGDPTDLRALVPRAALLLAGAALVARPDVAVMARRHQAPGWPGCVAPVDAPWALRLAALAMLPMMAALPQMLALCRSQSLGPSALLGLHLAAMFLPGLCLPRLAPGAASWLGLLLLALGALSALRPDWLAGLGPALALGAAWSLAWAARAAPAASAPRQHVAEHLEALPGGLGR